LAKRTKVWLVAIVLAAAAFAACGSNGRSDQPAGTGGVSGTAGARGGSSGAGTAGSSAGGNAGSAGSTVGTGGTSVPGEAGRGGSANAGTGGSSNAGAGGNAGSTGLAGNGGAGNGGSAGGGRGGQNGPGSGGRGGSSNGGSGGSGATPCTRELLRSTITAYFTALAAHSSSTLPLAPSVKFTENGKMMTLGEGLWRTAGAVKYAQSALDVEICSSGTHAVVPEGNMDVPVALRLRLQNGLITEIETIAVRPGDYKLSGQTFASNTGAIIAANSTVMWETPPAAAQRNTRAELIAWIDKYFRMFPRGVCNTVSSCRRLENGYGSFNCTDGASCAAGQPTGTPAMNPRILLADPDTGIGVGMTMFMGNTDMHMFKMYGGQVYAVHAVLGGATSSGWD
jgi:hypothetical protein